MSEDLKTNGMYDSEKIAEFFCKHILGRQTIKEWLSEQPNIPAILHPDIERISNEIETEDRISVIKTVKHEKDKNDVITEQYVYNRRGIFLEKHKWIKLKPENEGDEPEWKLQIFDTPLIRGKLIVTSKVEFAEMEKKTIKWVFSLDGKDFVGEFDEILKQMNDSGRLVGGIDECRRATSAIITELDIETKRVYPACGIFMNEETNTPVAALGDMVVPSLDSQVSFHTSRKYFENEVTKHEVISPREVVQATSDMITSMPDGNKRAALLARGFGVVAPICYLLKKSVMGVFPYLYLYGPRGTSKTHLSCYAATKIYGEQAALNSESIGSSFRLGMEFAATTFPRVIDEAQETFESSLAMFKAAATSPLATKRGNKDKSMDSYPAFCTFLLTSNSPPIDPEADAANAVSDRVVVTQCKTGEDFDNGTYQAALMILDNYGILFGNLTIGTILKEFEEKTMDGVIREIMQISEVIRKDFPTVQQRRLFCLSEIMWGVKLYYKMLEQHGIAMPVPFVDDSHLAIFLFDEGEGQRTEREGEFAKSFVEWCEGIAEAIESDRSGKFPTYKYAGAGIFPTKRGLVVTKNALKTYYRTFPQKTIAVKTIVELHERIKECGIRIEKPDVYGIGDCQKTARGIRLNGELPKEEKLKDCV